MAKMLIRTISWEVVKIFTQEVSNGDLWLTLSFFMARSDFLWQVQLAHPHSLTRVFPCCIYHL